MWFHIDSKQWKQYSDIDDILDLVLEENDADIPSGDSDSDILDSNGEWEYEIENIKHCNNSENVNNSIQIEKPGPSGLQLPNEDVTEPVYREMSNTTCEIENFKVLSSTRIHKKVKSVICLFTLKAALKTNQNMNQNIHHPPPMNLSQEKYQLEVKIKMQEEAQGLQENSSEASVLQKEVAEEVELQQDLAAEEVVEADNIAVQLQMLIAVPMQTRQ